MEDGRAQGHMSDPTSTFFMCSAPKQPIPTRKFTWGGNQSFRVEESPFGTSIGRKSWESKPCETRVVYFPP